MINIVFRHNPIDWGSPSISISAEARELFAGGLLFFGQFFALDFFSKNHTPHLKDDNIFDARRTQKFWLDATV